MASAGEALLAMFDNESNPKQSLIAWKKRQEAENASRYGSNLYSDSNESALKIAEVAASYSEVSPVKSGFEILNACFDSAFARFPHLVAMGEDIGRLGDVNQGFAGLQSKYGALRIMDTGIREATIVGQAIGLALRGFKPIADIQYLDYLLYAIEVLSDDLASLRWRTCGGQKAPVIIRTRGIGWRASGIQDLLWRESSIWSEASTSAFPEMQPRLWVYTIRSSDPMTAPLWSKC